MNDVVRMGFNQSLCDLGGDIDRFVELERLTFHFGEERLPADVLHYYEGVVTLLTHFVDRADVRMIECGGSPGFAYQSVPCVQVTGRGGWEKLDGDSSPQHGVFGEKHLSHSTRTEFLNDSVMTDKPSSQPYPVTSYGAVVDARGGC